MTTIGPLSVLTGPGLFTYDGHEWVGAMLNEGDRVSAILMRRDGDELHELRITHEEMRYHDRPTYIGEAKAPTKLRVERDEAVRTCDELRSLIQGQKEHVTKAQRERDDEKSRSCKAC